MAWLRDNHLPADPICYTLAYEYLFTENRQLKQDIDALKLSDDDEHDKIKQIYNKHIIAKSYKELSMHDEHTEEYAAAALSLLLGTKEDVQHISEKLSESQENRDSEVDQALAQKARTAAANLESAVKALNKGNDVDAKPLSYDKLTELLDNQGAFTVIKCLLADSENFPVSILRINLDKFKQLNDQNGKVMGDAVLKSLAKAFNAQLRGEDIISRYQGDEFTVFLPKTPLKSGVAVAENLRKRVLAISLKKKSSMTPVKASVSVGVAEFSGQGSFDKAFMKAKKAMLRSKDLGRNCVNCEN